MKIKTTTSLIISIVTVLSAVGGFIVLRRFTPKNLKADIHSHPETTAKNKANWVDSSLNKELLEAAGKGNIQDVQRLLMEGADINARDEEGTTALLRAAFLGHTEMAKILLKNANLDAEQKLTAMMWAERNGHTETARLLKQAGVKIADASLNEQLLYAAIKGDIREVQILLNIGAKVDTKESTDGSTALMLAAGKGHNRVVTLLLEEGADINAVNDFGGTALLWAIFEGHAEIAELFIKRDADVNAKHARTNITVLMMAVQHGYTEIVSTLLKKGVDVNIKDRNGYTALTYAAGEGHIEIAKLLIEQGRWTDTRESFGRALAVAVAKGHTEIAKLLIKKGANVNEKTKRYGFTTLMTAVNGGYTEIVQALIDKGADVNARATNGLTALDLAKKQEIVWLLQKAGARKD